MQLQVKTDKDLQYLEELNELTKNKKEQVADLEKKRQEITRLNSTDMELIVSLLSEQKTGKTALISSFLMGVISSLVASYLFSLRKKIIQDVKEMYASVAYMVKEKSESTGTD